MARCSSLQSPMSVFSDRTMSACRVKSLDVGFKVERTGDVSKEIQVKLSREGPRIGEE